MTALTWDGIGERTFQAGVDRGVLYLQDGTFAVWNGLTSVEDTSAADSQSFYSDGVKYLNTLTPGDFAGSLKAFTYPDIFDSVIGISDTDSGLSIHGQSPKSFNLSFRSKLGNDVDGIEHGYKIHILYNLLAAPDSYAYQSISDTSDNVIEFSWSLTGTPQKVAGFRPTSYITVDSTKVDSDSLSSLEDILYGTASADPSLPSISDIIALFSSSPPPPPPPTHNLVIADNGDGTWTATDDDNVYITMPSSTEIEITGANTTSIDPDTYTISNTP